MTRRATAPPNSPVAAFAILGDVFRTRSLLALLIALGLVAAFAPAIALAGGSSAGDNQYVDPLSGLHSHSGRGGGSSSSGSSGTASAPASAATSTAAGTSPTATSAAKTSTDPKGKRRLPFTGFQDWQAASLGGMLLIGGLGLRRRTRNRRRRVFASRF